jgi:peroxiredoxin
MVAFHQAHHNRNATVLGVAIDGYENKEAVMGFIRRHALNFPNLIDDGSAIAQAYFSGVGKPWYGWTPTYLMYSPTGKLMAQNIGPVSRQDLENYIRKTHAQEMARGQ